jgi:hypothetical protein
MYVLTYNHGTGRGCVTIHPTENEHAVALREHAILV